MNHLKTHQTNPTTAQYRPVQSNTSTAQYSQVQPIPEPDPKPELFGQTRPEVKKPYSSGPAYYHCPRINSVLALSLFVSKKKRTQERRKCSVVLGSGITTRRFHNPGKAKPKKGGLWGVLAMPRRSYMLICNAL